MASLFTTQQLILTSLAGFLFAIHVCVGLLSFHHDKRWKQANIYIFMATFLTGLYCISESITYSGVIKKESFWVMTTSFAGFLLPFYYLWSRIFLTENFEATPKYSILLFGIPGMVYSISTLYLDEASTSHLYQLYHNPQSFDQQSKSLHYFFTKSFATQLAIVSGSMHMVSIIWVFLSSIRFSIQSAKISANPKLQKNARWFTYFMACGGALILISGVFPMFLSSDMSAVFGPVASLPMSLFAFRSMQIKRSEMEQLARQKDQLIRYLPADLVTKIIRLEMSGQLGGEESCGSVMFCDIRGFTAMSEELPVQEVIKVLNEFFTLADEVVTQCGGNINKYIGDEYMGIFGIDQPIETGAEMAYRSALQILKKLDHLNQERARSGKVKIEIAMGIHTGSLLHGNVGSYGRMEYTVIGDTVNTAARITGLKSQFSHSLIISRKTLEQLHQQKTAFQLLGKFQLKGKKQPIELF